MRVLILNLYIAIQLYVYSFKNLHNIIRGIRDMDMIFAGYTVNRIIRSYE